MLTKIYTVYDKKSEAYMPPFFMKASGEAMRAFEDTVHDENHPFAKHPEDYILFEIGTFDDQTSVIETYKIPITLVKAIELCTEPQSLNMPEFLKPQNG